MSGTTAVVAAVMTGLQAWLVLAVSILVVVVLWAAMYYLVDRFPNRHGEQTSVDSVESSLTE